MTLEENHPKNKQKKNTYCRTSKLNVVIPDLEYIQGKCGDQEKKSTVSCAQTERANSLT